MSRVAMYWAWEAGTQARLDPTALAVLECLAYHANAYTGRAELLTATIGDQIGRDQGTIRRAFERLEDAGIIVRIRRRGRSVLWIFPDSARASARTSEQTPRTDDADPAHQRAEVRASARAITRGVVNQERPRVNMPVDNSACSVCQDTGWVDVTSTGPPLVTRCQCMSPPRPGKMAGRSPGPCAETPDDAPATAAPTRPPRSNRAAPAQPTPATSPTTTPNEPDGSPSSERRSGSHARAMMTWDRPQGRSP